ncbi:MAG TPA: response regulator transcription factor [Solirubrobacteraceae bacterium]|jgi:DNA-binding NarL/FixJ family response regulator|nr:response regulator transcription factor [Solirubrobacteraceae bacterium]
MKRLTIVADNSLIVDAIALGLRRSGEFEVLDHVDSRTASAPVIAGSLPDVVLIDDMGQSQQVVELVAQLRAQLDRVAVIVLTLAMESPWLDDVFAAGAAGAISKATHPGALTTLLRETVNGNVVHVSKRTAKGRAPRPQAVAANGSALTPRELEVLRLVASGSSNGEIAQALWVTEQTVKFHLSNVYKKLDVANRTEASHYALVHGLVSARKPVETP